MKKKIQFISLFILLAIGAYSQGLQTIKTYHDPLTKSRLHEIYTVKQNTGIKHGSYKSYDQNGYPNEEASFNNNVLHGAYKKYKLHAPRSGMLYETGTYNNGKQNGVWTYYSYNIYAPNDHYIESKRTYKDDAIIANTTFYAPANGKQQIKSIIEQTGDIQTHKTWYENGVLESDAKYKITVGRFRNNEEPITIYNYNKDGILIAKQENNIAYFYTEDGSTLRTKEDKNERFLEEFENGQLVRTTQEFYNEQSKINEYEVIEYNNGEKISRKILDGSGQDMEAKREKENLIKRYTELHNQLDKIKLKNEYGGDPLKLTLGREICYNRSKYHCEEEVDRLMQVYYQHKDELDKIASKRKEFQVMHNKVDNDNLIGLEEHVRVMNEVYLPQKEYLLAIKDPLEELVARLYQIECDFTTVKNQYKGTTYKGSVLEITLKPRLYEAYRQVADYLIVKIENSSDLIEVSTAISQYNTISGKLLEWKNGKTSGIEKLLKNAKTVEAKLEVFLKNEEIK